MQIFVIFVLLLFSKASVHSCNIAHQWASTTPDWPDSYFVVELKPNNFSDSVCDIIVKVKSFSGCLMMDSAQVTGRISSHPVYDIYNVNFSKIARVHKYFREPWIITPFQDKEGNESQLLWMCSPFFERISLSESGEPLSVIQLPSLLQQTENNIHSPEVILDETATIFLTQNCKRVARKI